MIEAGYIYYTYINWSLPFIAVAQTLFGVMRGAGDVKNPMKITLLMNVVNIALSYVLILGVTIPIINFDIPSLGMHGAGLAIAIARLVGPIWAFKVIFSPKSGVCLNKLKFYMPTGQMQKNIMTLGVPTGIEQLLFQAGRMGTLMFMIGMGTAVMAANVVAMNIMGFIMIPGNALTISLMVMVGQRIGRKDFDDIAKVSYFAVAVGAAFMTVLSLIMIPTGGFFITVFGLDTEAAGYFNQLYRSLIIGGPLLWPLSFIIPSALRAAEDVKFTMIVSVSSMWLFRIALGYYLGIFLGYGVMGVWIGLYGDWAARSAIFLFRLNRKKWLRKFI
jgi:putative MATE family efflux protein